MTRVHVATLNIRNQFDRWDERLPLLLADMRGLQPDLMGLQEVAFTMQQDRILAAAGPAEYAILRGWVGQPEYGNSLLIRSHLEAGPSRRIDLGFYKRSAIGTIVGLGDERTVLLVCTHILGDHEETVVRDAQVGALLEWLETWPPTDAVVVIGDYNVRPTQPPYARMLAAGFRSAFVEANGAEPASTWPSGIVAEGQDEGSAQCLDYIWVRGSVAVEDCRLICDRPAVGDPTLYPSDHIGLAAHLNVGRRG